MSAPAANIHYRQRGRLSVRTNRLVSYIVFSIYTSYWALVSLYPHGIISVVDAFTPGQRRVIVLLVVLVIAVFAMLAGFIATSLRELRSSVASPLPTPTVVLTPTPSSAPVLTVESEPWSQVQAARLLSQIGRQMEVVRGLSSPAEMPLNFLDAREMRGLLRALYLERDPDARLLPYMAVGLLPDVAVSVEAHEAAGVYVAEQDQLYILLGERGGSLDDQTVLAHAYVHALQDRAFDLAALDIRPLTTDSALAYQALVEGDAMLAAAFYRYRDPAAADWNALTELILRAEQPGYGEALDGDAAWIGLRRFPYWEGRYFVAALFESEGWGAVNRAYADPPRSTEQVLHPERYLERDVPEAVRVPDLEAALGEGWTLLLRDTLGEFVIGLLLDETLPGLTAWSAADGWDGDTFIVWEREGGARAWVWRTVWDDTAEAVEFEQALVALTLQRYSPVTPVQLPVDAEGQWWITDAGTFYVSRVARYVIYGYAPDLDALTRMVEELS